MSTTSTDAAPTPPPAPASAAPRRWRGPEVALPVGRQIWAWVILTVIAAISAFTLPALVAGGIMIGLGILILVRRTLFSWPGALGLLIGVILVIPVRQYALPIPLPFALEAYRAVLAVLLLALVLAFVLDRKRTWQPVAFGWPIGIFFASLVISIPANGDALVDQGLASTAVSSLVNYLILFSVFFIVRQIVTTERMVNGVLVGLVWGGVVIALFAIVERATRSNFFVRLHEFLPLQVLAEEPEAFRAGGYRSFASSQHPIALSVMFCLMVAIAIYLAKFGLWPRNEINRRVVYGLATVVLLGGVLSAVSRTAVVVMAVMILVTLIFRPWLGVTLISLSLPALFIGLVALPRVFETLVLSFLDVDSLIASQQTSPGWRGAGRLADLGPAMEEFARFPFFGTGVGSRIVVGDEQNAFILDNQVLGTLLETGVVGLLGLIALMVVPVILLLRWAFTVARNDPPYAMLAFTLAVAGAGYCASFFFFDAFGFYQTLFIWFIMLAIGAWLLTSSAPAIAAKRARAAGPAKALVG